MQFICWEKGNSYTHFFDCLGRHLQSSDTEQRLSILLHSEVALICYTPALDDLLCFMRQEAIHVALMTELTRFATSDHENVCSFRQNKKVR